MIESSGKNFLGLEFHPFDLQSKEKIDPILKKYPHCLAGYTFAFLFSLSGVYKYEWAWIEEETLLISRWVDSERHLIAPVGLFSKNAQELLLKAISNLSYKLKIFHVSENFVAEHQTFCSYFEDHIDRNKANYLYNSLDLATLSGGHYDKKRNLIAQAENLYSFKIETLNEKNSPHCPKILENIGKREGIETSVTLQNELKGLDKMLSYFKELHVKGVVIHIDNHPAAFSIYGAMNENTVDIYFEKADRHFKGLYQLINRETAKMILQEGYELINREEDLGIAGLKQAKLSYHPIKLIPSHVLHFRL